VVDSGDGPGETKSDEDASGVSSSESSNRSISVLGAFAFGSTSGGGEVGKGSTNGDQDEGLDSGSHVENASDGGGNFENEEGDEADSSEGTGESHPSVHVAVRGDAGEKEFPGSGSVLHEAFEGGDFFGILGCELSGLLELLGVGELSRLVQESLKAGAVGDDLLIFLLRADLDDAVVLVGEFGLFGLELEDEADGVKLILDSTGFVFEACGRNFNFDSGFVLAVGKHDHLVLERDEINTGGSLIVLFSMVVTHGG